MGNLNNINNNMVACELFTSSVCNLNCDYCYIPKNNEMKKYHKHILSKINDGTFIKLLKKIYGNNLTHLGFWGTEPTLILQHYTKNVKIYIDTFPKLRAIDFSSNLYAFPERIIAFSDELEKYAKNKITLNWQVSLDGPKWINDINRGKGTTEKILENIDIYFNLLKKKKYNKITIDFSIKPTVSLKNIEMLNKNISKIKEWYIFYDKIISNINSKVKDIKVKIRFPKSVTPTLVVPGKYSVKDGKKLKKFFKNINEIEKMKKEEGILKNIDLPLNNYEGRLLDIIFNSKRISTHVREGTCSGGDTNFGLNLEGNLHLCHRTFLYDNPDYINKTLNPSNNIENWDVSRMQSGIIKQINKSLITKIDGPEREINRFNYVTRGYHDTLSFKISNTVGQIKSLALAGQTNDIYLKNENITNLLALFLNTKMSCPMENFLQTGSIHLSPISLTRLFANGAFEIMIKNFLKKREESNFEK